MYEIGKLLPSAFKKQVRRTDPHWLGILLPLWPCIAGKTMAQRCQPGLLRSGVLTLETDSTTWATQLRQMREEIRAEINAFLGQPVVGKLRIIVVPQLDLFSQRKSSRLPPRRPAPADVAADTAAIPDPEIARIVAASYAKYFARERR